ncbi:hypothetical protein LBMAG53_38650 [Planctomycetota bacterium]|nr:hypothetical protein LBMAG53_38650 [Planctomycetota bacterium]
MLIGNMINKLSFRRKYHQPLCDVKNTKKIGGEFNGDVLPESDLNVSLLFLLCSFYESNLEDLLINLLDANITEDNIFHNRIAREIKIISGLGKYDEYFNSTWSF